jgi:acetyl esterase/lipase
LQALLKALTRLILRAFFKPFIGPPFPVGFQRRWLTILTAGAAPPKGIESSDVWAGDIRIVRHREGLGPGPTEAAGRDAILYVHGGGFVAGSAAGYAGIAGWLAQLTGADVFVPEYRLAPEHAYPAATDDVFTAYRAVLELGYSPRRTAIVADSAGGTLAVSTARVLPEMNVPSPAAVVLISPWLDLTLTSSSVAANARRDPMLRRSWLEQAALSYAGELRRSDPRVSPLFADLSNLPPTLIQVGSDEILLDDSIRFADRAWAAGAEVELQRFDGWWHDFQTSAAMLRPARDALVDVAGFLKRRLDD